MNRPELDDSIDIFETNKIWDFIRNIETYCDEIETQLKIANIENKKLLQDKNLLEKANDEYQNVQHTIFMDMCKYKKALDKALYKWITHEQPKAVKGVGDSFDVSVKKAIELNKSVILKEVQDVEN